MKTTIIQHVPFESPGYFLDLLTEAGSEIRYLNQFEPGSDGDWGYDLLLVMGGPMNIYQESLYPWLKEEKKMIRNAIDKEKLVIGVCLGAQLIANALGKKTYKGVSREIGWFPVQKTNQEILNFLPDVATVFHWHGETFDLPEDCISFYRSEITENQAFIYKDRVLALQFHLEMNEKGGNLLCENCREEIDGSQFVMTEREIIEGFERYKYSNHKMLRNLLKWFLEKTG